MIQSTVTISNRLGLHARASAKLTKLVSGYRCDVFLSRNGRRVNAKSIMGVMMLAAGLGTTIEIEVDGVDEQQGRIGEEEGGGDFYRKVDVARRIVEMNYRSLFRIGDAVGLIG